MFLCSYQLLWTLSSRRVVRTERKLISQTNYVFSSFIVFISHHFLSCEHSLSAPHYLLVTDLKLNHQQKEMARQMYNGREEKTENLYYSAQFKYRVLCKLLEDSVGHLCVLCVWKTSVNQIEHC